MGTNVKYALEDMTKYTAFRCPEDLLEKAKIKAKNDRRSLSNYLITLIEKDVKNDDFSSGIKDAKKPARKKKAKRS
jgi:predicted DNA-binding protein